MKNLILLCVFVLSGCASNKATLPFYWDSYKGVLVDDDKTFSVTIDERTNMYMPIDSEGKVRKSRSVTLDLVRDGKPAGVGITGYDDEGDGVWDRVEQRLLEPNDEYAKKMLNMAVSSLLKDGKTTEHWVFDEKLGYHVKVSK